MGGVAAAEGPGTDLDCGPACGPPAFLFEVRSVAVAGADMRGRVEALKLGFGEVGGACFGCGVGWVRVGGLGLLDADIGGELANS